MAAAQLRAVKVLKFVQKGAKDSEGGEDSEGSDGCEGSEDNHASEVVKVCSRGNAFQGISAISVLRNDESSECVLLLQKFCP